MMLLSTLGEQVYFAASTFDMSGSRRRPGLAQNEMRAKPALPERVRSMEGLARTRDNVR